MSSDFLPRHRETRLPDPRRKCPPQPILLPPRYPERFPCLGPPVAAVPVLDRLDRGQIVGVLGLPRPHPRPTVPLAEIPLPTRHRL